MLEFTNESRNRPWLRLSELEELESDPSVLDMIKAIQPLMGPFQEKLHKVLYPNVAEDAATVRELIGRFEGRTGLYFLADRPWLHPATAGTAADATCAACCCTSPIPTRTRPNRVARRRGRRPSATSVDAVWT